jgi:hypothetical protein
MDDLLRILLVTYRPYVSYHPTMRVAADYEMWHDGFMAVSDRTSTHFILSVEPLNSHFSALAGSVEAPVKLTFCASEAQYLVTSMPLIASTKLYH